MTRSELNKFVEQNLSEQGNASSIVLAQLAEELMKHTPCVIHPSIDKMSVDDYGVKYELLDSKNEIDTIIDALIETDVPSLYAKFGNGMVQFSNFEINASESDPSVTAYANIVELVGDNATETKYMAGLSKNYGSIFYALK